MKKDLGRVEPFDGTNIADRRKCAGTEALKMEPARKSDPEWD